MRETELDEVLGVGGTIIGRQSTYVDVQRARDGACYRVDFRRSHETSIEFVEYAQAQLFSEHPVLEHHHDDRITIFIASVPPNPKLALELATTEIRRHTDGWRAADIGLNNEYGAERVLAEGQGMLYRGPARCAHRVAEQLRSLGLTITLDAPSPGPAPQAQILLLGSSWIVADRFRVRAR